MTLNFTELLNIVACASSCSNSMINTTGVLESTDNMKKMEIFPTDIFHNQNNILPVQQDEVEYIVDLNIC